jgi:ATP-dependent phosphofructokinase / diphosphate-dependent phosphofructokinase
MKQKSPPRNAFYAQSGGVTAVINASACGVIETCRKHKGRIGKVYAGRHGILGALTEDLIDTGLESAASIRALRHTPSGAFGSARYKLKKFEDHPAQYQRLIEVFKAHDIGYFFYNGGGDSADTCLKVSVLAEKLGYPLTAIHVPKTVDNDLPITDCCPGFGSVAKYVAVSIREAGFDVASMARTSTKVFVLEVMGRHAGWIAAAGGLAAEKAGDSPHIILFPEIPFEEEKFLARTKECVDKFGYCAVVVSEGVRNSEGKFLADAGTRDAFGHAQLGGVGPVVAQLVKDKLGYKYHWATTCSAPPGTSRPRWTSSRPTRSARPRWSSRSRVTTRSCRPSSAPRRSPIVGRSAWRRSTRSQTWKRCCRGTTSPRTVSTSRRRVGATSPR